MKPESRWHFLPAGLALLLGLAALYMFPSWTVDDAYITYRYAANLLDHGELNWNPGEDPVEGYTGVFLPLYIAAAMRAGVAPETASDALGVLSWIMTSLLLWVMLGRIGLPSVLRSAASALWMTAPMGYIHALSGLETMTYSAATMLCLERYSSALENTGRSAARESLFCLSALFVCTIRPEGAVFAGVFLAALIVDRSRTDARAVAGLLVRVFVLFILPGGAYFLARWTYYGRLLPNTFYAKSYKEEWIDAKSLSSLTDFSMNYILPLAVISIAVCLTHRAAGREREPDAVNGNRAPEAPWIAIPLAIGLAIIVQQYVRTSLVMNYADRFYAQHFPLLLVLILIFPARALRSGAVSDSARKGVIALSLGLFAWQMFTHAVEWKSNTEFADGYDRLLRGENQAAAGYIMETVPHEETLAVCLDAGIVPYLTRMRTIDFGRLNDEFLAGRERPDAEQADYFFRCDPGVAMITSTDWNEQKYNDRIDAITSDPRFDNYILAKKFKPVGMKRKPSYYQFVYIRRDLLSSAAE